MDVVMAVRGAVLTVQEGVAGLRRTLENHRAVTATGELTAGERRAARAAKPALWATDILTVSLCVFVCVK